MNCQFLLATKDVRKKIALVLCLLFFSNWTKAVEPTEVEWHSWPDFCKAAFLGSQWAQGSPYLGRMAEAQVNSLRVSTGIPGPHHFCVGMLYINRARSKGQNSNTAFNLGRAIDEINYSFSRMTSESARYSLVTAYYGTAFYRSGKRQQAMEMWNKGIEAKPASRESYLAMAEVLLQEKKAKDALDLLLRYEKAKENDAPDAEAFLSHTYIELGDFDKARVHADKAYLLGYPLPGLRNKLERLSKQR